MKCGTRLLRFASGVAITTTLLGAVVSPASARHASQAPLDIPAAVLFPADVEAEGVDGFGLGYSEYRHPEQITEKVICGCSGGGGEPLDFIEPAGVLGAYELDLTSRVEGEDPALSSTYTIISYVYETEDEAGAAQLFSSFDVESDDPYAEDLDLPDVIGDESELSSFPADALDDSGEHHDAEVLDLSFRVGRLYMGVQLLDFDFEEIDGVELESPSTDLVIALAQRLADKAADVLDGDTAGLSAKAVHLKGSDVVGLAEVYDAYGGAVNQEFGEGPDIVEDRQAVIEEYGIVNRYSLHQSFGADNAVTSSAPYFANRVYQFDNARDAKAFMAGALDPSRVGSGYDAISVIDDLPRDLGDFAVGASYTYTRSDGPDSEGMILYVQVGDMGFVMQLDTEDGVDLDTLLDVAYAQLDCLADSGCVAPTVRVNL